MKTAVALSTGEAASVAKKDIIAVRVTEIISQKFGVEEFAHEHSFRDDLGVDSLDIYEMIMEVEKEFHIKITDEDAERLLTVGSIIKYVEQKKH